jgi:phosphoadenosine phosphosulfate reductase
MSQHIDHSVEVLQAAVEEFGAGAFATSSFQTQGMPLLHLISQHAPRMMVFFLDTGFHFPETYEFLKRVSARFSIRSIVVTSSVSWMPEAEQALERGDTDHCCNLLKVRPLQNLLTVQAQLRSSCWISGVRHDQTRARVGLQGRESTEQGVTRIHPMLDWTSDQVDEYIESHGLPRHPLTARGYPSIGCEPCTVPGDGRSGRWPGQPKEGCGIHHLLNREVCDEPDPTDPGELLGPPL